ncbi:MAG: hypothetical protein UH241_04680 [Acutalibacteraceae bacterium]|nr:hypothetical protein [Acutalibacteraceae bacterium]
MAFNSGVSKYLETKQKEEEQKKLRTKYETDENVLVVEKSNTLKFILKLVINGTQLVATVLLILLATIGLLGLIYPETRQAYTNILSQILNQLQDFI